jgi:transcriptional regulator with XRE-family HTH domain
MTFGAVLVAELARRNWSQGDLAFSAGITEGSVSRYCRDHRHPSRAMVDAIVDALGPRCGPGALYHAAGFLSPSEWAAAVEEAA